MRKFYMQKTPRNASHLYGKNAAKRVNFIRKKHLKCVKFLCKKHCEMRRFSAHFPANFAVFLAYKFDAFSSVFCVSIV